MPKCYHTGFKLTECDKAAGLMGYNPAILIQPSNLMWESDSNQCSNNGASSPTTFDATPPETYIFPR